MNGDPQQALEALKLLKDWSSGLVLVQGGIMSVIGALLKGTEQKAARVTALLSFVASVLSIVAAANVLGSLPTIAENLGRTAGQSIYDQPANMLLTVRTNCTLEATFFIIGLIFFIAFAWLRRETQNASSGRAA